MGGGDNFLFFIFIFIFFIGEGGGRGALSVQGSLIRGKAIVVLGPYLITLHFRIKVPGLI